MIESASGRARTGLVARSLRVAVLLGTSTAVLALMGGVLSGPSFAGRALDFSTHANPLKLSSPQLALNQIDLCIEYGETSPECLNALATLSPAAGQASSGTGSGRSKDERDGNNGN